MKERSFNMVKQLFTLLILLGVNSVLLAQSITVSGNVSNTNGDPIPSVRILVKGTTTGVLTDIDGNYSVTATNNDSLTLRFSSLAFEPREILVGGRTKIDVQLFKITQLEETVIVGYGKATSKELTGATSKVDGEAVEKMNLSRMDQALQGKVAGVAISTNSGSPGGSSNIRIRGLSTFGDNDPLILVDGIVYDSQGLNALNPADIKSINVLKDATAGIYGVRAANGVIIVETKNGSIGSKQTFEYNGYYGVQQTARKLNLLTAEEYAVIKNEAFALGGQPLPFPNTALGVGTNWQDSIFQNAAMQSHSLNLSGGSKSTSYSLGLTYFTQDGIVGGPKASFDRYNARANISTNLSDKMRLNSVFLYSNEYRTGLPEGGIGSVLYNTVNAFPNEPIRTLDGNFSYLEEVADIINPVAQIENTFNYASTDKFVGKEEIAYDFNEHFTFTNRFNYNFALVNSKVFSPLAWFGPGKFANTAINEDLESPMVEIADSVFIERGASVYEERATFTDLNYESFLNFDQTFSDIHRVKATLGFSIFQRRGESLSGTAFGVPNNSLDFADISANTAEGGFLNNVGSYEFQERLLSTFLRAEYSYKYRYLFSAILRRDGSSKFGENNRYGIFPTVSAAWIMSDEDFWNVDFIDYFKFRASYGVSGNDQIANFAYRALLNGEGVYVFGDVITPGVAIGRGSNPDLKWETTRQFNFGVDMTVWDQFNFTANYFVKNTYDLLFQPDISGILGTYGPGGFPPVINAGDVSNQGLELEMGYETDPTKDFTFAGNFNFTKIRNRVTAVPDGVDFLPGAGFSVGGNVATRFEEGFAIGYFNGYQTAGIFQDAEQIANHPVEQEGAQPGDLIFVDQNGDGVINFSDDSDKANIGSPIPDFTMGLVLNVGWKGFDLSASLYAALGQEIIRNYERQQPFANQLDYVVDRWTGPGSTNEHPRVTTGQTRNNVFSDYFVEDGSFARLRNVQIGYTLPATVLEKIRVGSLRFYVAANNLVTLTRYQGFDPDVGSAGVLSSGVDYGIYPQARTVMGGVNLKF